MYLTLVWQNIWYLKREEDFSIPSIIEQYDKLEARASEHKSHMFPIIKCISRGTKIKTRLYLLHFLFFETFQSQ